MAARSPYHTILLSLLEKKQFDACQTTVEDLIAAEMAADAPDDLELAHLYLFLCRACQGLHQFELAAEKADVAVVMAQKAKEQELVGEALFRAGVNLGQAGEYSKAVERFTASLDSGTDAFKAKVLFNRGHAYSREKAYSFAIRDFEEAIRVASDTHPQLVQLCRINLAWMLILENELAKAEEVLEQLSGAPETEKDRYTQLQLRHDRLHVAVLKGAGRDALAGALAALREAGQDYPEVKARIAQTLMLLATERGMPEEAFAFGLLTKGLAGQANRPDIDEEASDAIEELEIETGTDHLIQSLFRAGQVTRVTTTARRSARHEQRMGGVG